MYLMLAAAALTQRSLETECPTTSRRLLYPLSMNFFAVHISHLRYAVLFTLISPGSLPNALVSNTFRKLVDVLGPQQLPSIAVEVVNISISPW